MSLYTWFAKFIKLTIDGEKYERIIADDDVYDVSNICPTCGVNGERKPIWKVQSNPLVEFLYCPACRGVSASKMPTDEYLYSYYKNYYVEDDKKITFFGDVGRFARHIVRYTPFSNERNKIRILDFGGGDGSVAKEVANIILANNPNVENVLIVLVDYQKQEYYHNDAIEFIRMESLDEVDHNFDIIIASAILEHIPVLNSTMQKLLSLIDCGGYLYVRVPYIMPFKRIFRNIPLLYPMHVHDLGPSFWNRIIERYNFNGTILSSRPPLPETEFKTHFFYTLLSHLFKIPAFIELIVRNRPKDMIWNYVAGWEIVVKKI